MLSSIKDRVRNVHVSRIEITLLVVLLMFGIPMIVLIPPGAGYDEEDHLVRVWELSAFSIVPGQLSPQEMKYPTLYRDFAYRQQGSTGILDDEFWQKYARASFYEYGFVRRELDTRNVYPPALLLPQALTLRLLGRSANLPALWVFYACRLASLVSYLILTWLAIRWLPFGKWIFLVLMVSPMALFQAATITSDAISNGIGFLFIAGSLRATEFEKIDWKEFAKLAFLFFLLFLAKLNLIPLVLLPFLLIPPARFARKGMYLLLPITALVLLLIEVAGWNAIATAHMNPLLANEANLREQLLYMLAHPFTFLQTLLGDFLTNGPLYFREWLNGYGYYYWTPPWIVSLLFLLGLAAALLSDDSALQRVNRKMSAVFLLVFLAGYLATVVPLYATFTPVGSDQVFGVQGRYFIPLALLLFLTLASLPWIRKIPRTYPKWIMALVTATLILNAAGIFLAFHVFCGSTFYQTRLCYRPLFKGFPSMDRSSQPISKETTLVQEIQVDCNGLAGLRLWTLPSTPGDEGSTHFTLQASLDSQTLVDTSITNEAIPSEDWYSLYFEPDWHSAGKQYILTIAGTNAPGTWGLKFPYTLSDLDLGIFYENGTSMQENLILQYGCATGLRKLWLTGSP